MIFHLYFISYFFFRAEVLSIIGIYTSKFKKADAKTNANDIDRSHHSEAPNLILQIILYLVLSIIQFRYETIVSTILTMNKMTRIMVLLQFQVEIYHSHFLFTS